jgi:hypothetical protein
MTTKAAEKIIEALTQLVEGFAELQEQVEQDYDPEAQTEESDEGDDSEGAGGLEEALVTEVRAAVESVIENEDCAPEDLATVISALTDALGEIAPEVLAEEEEESEEEEEEYEDDEDDIDLDDDDYDYDEDEEEEEEEEDDEDDDD